MAAMRGVPTLVRPPVERVYFHQSPGAQWGFRPVWMHGSTTGRTALLPAAAVLAVHDWVLIPYEMVPSGLGWVPPPRATIPAYFIAPALTLR